MTQLQNRKLFFYRQDMKAIRRFSIAVLILFIVFAEVHLNRQASLKGTAQPLDSVAAFEHLDLETLDGSRFTSADLKDYDVIAVDIWATWCFHCVQEMPAMASFSDQLPTVFPDQKVLYIGICTDLVKQDGSIDQDLAAEAKKISAEAGVHYPQLIADQSFNDEFTSLYVTGYPTIFYLNSAGQIIHTTGGLTESGLSLAISNLLEMEQAKGDSK